MNLLVHSDNVLNLCRDMGKILKLNDTDYFYLCICAKFHDIGKFLIPDKILDKKGRLSQYEYEIVKTHTVFGATILDKCGYEPIVTYSVLCHHERFDGKGYMKGLKGEQIPFYSRIITIADSYDAMTNVRPYSKPFSITDALDEIKRCSGTQFDPLLAGIFIDMIETSNKNEMVSGKNMVLQIGSYGLK